MNPDVILTALFLTSASGYLLLGARLWQLGDVGHRRVSVSFCLLSVLIVAGTAQFLALNETMLLAGRIAHFIAAAALPFVALVIFRHYIGKALSPAPLALLAIIPLLSIVVALSNPWHGWLWQGGLNATLQGWGPWFLYVHAPYSYLLLSTSLLSLVLHSKAVIPGSRSTVLLLASVVFIVFAALISHDFGVGVAASVMLPAALAILLPAFAWLVFQAQVVEFVPLAYETVFQNMHDPVVVVDERQRVIGLNRGAERLLKVRETDALRVSLRSLFGTEMPEVYDALQTGLPQKMLTSTGRFLHLQTSPLHDRRKGGRTGQVLMFRDVSDVEKAQQDVRSSEKLLRTLIDHSVNGVVRLRWSTESGCRRLHCVFANGAAGRFLQVNPVTMLNRPASEIIQLACSGMSADDARSTVDKFLSDTAQGEVVDFETCVKCRTDGKWLRVIAEPVGDNVAVTFVDVTDRKAKELQMESIAWSDPLTGVLNRRGFERDAAQRLSMSDDLASGALLFVDLNDFKKINDRCGHEVGDLLLTIAADRLRKTLRSCDIIGRPGGDEFVALVPDVTAELADTLAASLSQTLEQPYRIGDARLHCSASIGMALYPQHANTLTGLMRAADQAMYRAKERSRGVTELHRSNLLEKAG